MKSVLVLIAAVQCLCTSCADVPTKESRIRGAFFGSLVADALTLGSHYEYDAPTIKKAYGGTISRYMGPGEMMGGSTHGVGWGRRNYHPGQKAGDQTDYGEQTIVILEYLAQRKNKKDAIQLKDLIPHWRKRLEGDWGAWKDSQTKQTLQQLSQGAPMQKNSLGGGSNAMALKHAGAHAVFDQEKDMAQAARDVMFTHQNSEALGGGEFFARVTHKIIHENMKPMDAMTAAAKTLGKWYVDKVQQGVTKFKEAVDPSTQLSKEALGGRLGCLEGQPIKADFAAIEPGSTLSEKQSWWWVECNGFETCRSSCCLRPGEGHGSGSSRCYVHTPKLRGARWRRVLRASCAQDHP